MNKIYSCCFWYLLYMRFDRNINLKSKHFYFIVIVIMAPQGFIYHIHTSHVYRKCVAHKCFPLMLNTLLFTTWYSTVCLQYQFECGSIARALVGLLCMKAWVGLGKYLPQYTVSMKTLFNDHGHMYFWTSYSWMEAFYWSNIFGESYFN